MPIIHAIVLGFVQGLTEFLPVSSSGHLIIVPWLLGWHDFTGSNGLSVQKAFDVALHIGTLIAAIGYFRRDLVVYFREGIKAARDRAHASVEGKLAWLLVASSIPAAIVGAVLEKTIDNKLGKPILIAISLIVFGALLGYADRRVGTRPLESYDRHDAVVIGAAQILSLNPGTSRSGITITAGRFRGLSRDAAARASFLMSLPVTAGAILYKMAKLAKDGMPHGLAGAMVVGIIVSGIAGWLAVWGTIRLVRTHSFTPFVIYRFAMAALVFVAAVTFRH